MSKLMYRPSRNGPLDNDMQIVEKQVACLRIRLIQYMCKSHKDLYSRFTLT